jgi:hypothetical protein
MTAATDRARALAFQARRNATARTRLNMAIHQLESARDHAGEADMARQARTLDRLTREATEVLHGWPVPVRDRIGVAS